MLNSGNESSSSSILDSNSLPPHGIEPALQQLKVTHKFISMRDKITEELEQSEQKYFKALAANRGGESGSNSASLARIIDSIAETRTELENVSYALKNSIQRSIQSLRNAKESPLSQSEIHIIDSQIKKMFEVLESVDTSHQQGSDCHERFASQSQKLEASLNRIFDTELRGPTANQPNFTFTVTSPSMSDIDESGNFAESSQGHQQSNRSLVMRQPARERAVEMQNNEILNRLTRHALHEKSLRTMSESSINIDDGSMRKKTFNMHDEFSEKDKSSHEIFLFYEMFIDNFCTGEKNWH